MKAVTSTNAAPRGYRWVFCAAYKHAKSGKIMRATDYGRTCWAFLVRAK
jgi:hypothetical protein